MTERHFIVLPEGTATYRYEPFVEGDAAGMRVTDPNGRVTVVTLVPPSTIANPTDVPLASKGDVWLAINGLCTSRVATASEPEEIP